MLGKRSAMGSSWLQQIDYKGEINYYGNTCSLEIDVQDRKIKMTIASAPLYECIKKFEFDPWQSRQQNKDARYKGRPTRIISIKSWICGEISPIAFLNKQKIIKVKISIILAS